jgi:hypothetical protein
MLNFAAMRVVGEIPHPECKITIFHWNNRYLLKLESGLLEQTFKVEEYDLASEEDLKKIVSVRFIKKALDRFEEMAASLQDEVNSLS